MKKAFLYTLICAVALSAILGVAGILGGSGGWVELRMILTTVTISVASICGLACGAYLETRRGRVLPVIGLGLALLAGSLVIAALWLEPKSEAYWRLTGSTTTLAIAFAHLSFLSMARLANRFRWARYAGFGFVLTVAGIIVAMILADERGGEGVWKLLAVMAIGAASITVLTPIFHWLSRHDLAETVSDPVARRLKIEEEIATLKARIVDLEKQKQEIS
jgi:hypothetical protein